MSDITVRKIRFSFDEPIDFDVSDEMLSAILPPLGLSMTMPYLEPYLIRTMKVALKQITDPELAEDTRSRSPTRSSRRTRDASPSRRGTTSATTRC
jgi:predicted metal-dependent hydrolase